MHNGPFYEPASHGIPGIIFQAKVTKCGTNIWWNTLIDISSGFYQHHQKILAIFFFAFSNFTHWKSWLALSCPQFLSDLFEMWQRNLLPQNLRQVRLWRFCIIWYVHNGPFNERASFGIPGIIFQAKVTKFGTNVRLNKLFNITSVFYHHWKTKFGEIFMPFPALCIGKHC